MAAARLGQREGPLFPKGPKELGTDSPGRRELENFSFPSLCQAFEKWHRNLAARGLRRGRRQLESPE